MNSNFVNDAQIWKKGSARLIAEYSEKARRIDLLRRYNGAVGKPCWSVIRVQEDFLKGRMESAEVVAFVSLCEKLIAAVRIR